MRLSLIANALVTPLVSLVYFYPDYSYKLLLFGCPPGITAPLFMLLLALHIRKSGQKIRNSMNPVQSMQASNIETKLAKESLSRPAPTLCSEVFREGGSSEAKSK